MILGVKWIRHIGVIIVFISWLTTSVVSWKKERRIIEEVRKSFRKMSSHFNMDWRNHILNGGNL